MSYDGSTASAFDKVAGVRQRRPKTHPLSVRFTDDERERLVAAAGIVPVGTYIRAKALGGGALPARRAGQNIADKQALAQVLGLLGKTHYASNINQLAHLANLGVLPLTPRWWKD